MATKNFLFLLVASAFIFSGCETTERRNYRTTGNSAPHEPMYKQPGSTANSENSANSGRSSGNFSDSSQFQNNPGAPGTPGSPGAVAQGVTPTGTPLPAIPFKVLPVGVFFGPGSMRSFAHIGVLRALQQAGVPIVAVGGMEWGSVIAASFALSGKANEVEWQLMKLKAEQLPGLSLLHRELTASDPAQLSPFLKSIFAENTFERGQLPFRCPYTDGDQTLFVSRGLAREQLVKCVAVPPLFGSVDQNNKSWMSGAVNPGDWSGELKKAGAQFIIYVDVVSKGPSVHSSAKYASPSEVKALWAAIKTLSKAQHGFANLTIEVPMDFDLSDFSRRREAITMGEEAAKTSMNQTLRSIGVLQ